MNKQLSILLALLLLTTQVTAAEVAAEKKSEKEPLLNKQKFSVGAGLSYNSAGSSDEVGFQFFAAYDISEVDLMEGVNTSVELGYMDYGSFQGASGGLWATAVIDGNISGKLGWLARAGFDFGDDSGFLIGAGLGLDIDEKMALRFEYVIRDDIDSIQLNLIYHM